MEVEVNPIAWIGIGVTQESRCVSHVPPDYLSIDSILPGPIASLTPWASSRSNSVRRSRGSWPGPQKIPLHLSWPIFSYKGASCASAASPLLAAALSRRNSVAVPSNSVFFQA
jgi:hypothetical protein